MTQDDAGYELRGGPSPERDSAPASPRPGEPGWVPPVPIIEKADPPESEAALADPDVEKNKGMAILAYICFLIPLLAAPTSPFARFHANQGVLVFIFWCVAIAGNIALYGVSLAVTHFLAQITVLSYFLSCMIPLLDLALLLAALALTIFGIVKAANGEKTPLPVLGQLTLIK